MIFPLGELYIVEIVLKKKETVFILLQLLKQITRLGKQSIVNTLFTSGVSSV